MCFEIVFILRLYFAERPLREAHLQVLHNTQNRTDNVEQQAGWSNKSWTLVINEILSKLSCPEVLERLRLTRAPLHASDLKVCREDASVFFGTMPGDMCPKGMEHGKSVRNSAAFLAGSL